MNKKYLFIPIFLVVCVFFVSSCSKKENKSDTSGRADKMAEKQVKSENIEFSGSLKDLLNKKNKEVCSFSGEDTEVRFSGKTYVGERKVRQEINFFMDGSEKSMYMIIDGDTVYTWGTEMPGKGSKMSLSALESGVSEMPELPELESELEETNEDGKDFVPEKDLQDFEKDYKYNCKTWKVDQSILTPPADVEFIDLNEMAEEMKAQMDNIQGSMGDACSVCDIAPNMEECKASLGC